MKWLLMVVLTWTAEPRATWHDTHEACEAARAVAVAANPDAVHVTCRSYAIPRLAPMTGELLR